jgi:tetratricopeptide (TPR) repeat protein
MTQTTTSTADAIATAIEHYRHARWSDAYDVLEHRLGDESDPVEAARCRLWLVEGYNTEDFKRGLQPARDKHAILDQVDEVVDGHCDELFAKSLFHRGMALHIEFIMVEGDPDRELSCFTRAAELFETCGDMESASMATALIGVFHHVDHLDRETARPILQRAYDMAPEGTSLGRAEAARHLGQIQQELGDPAGGLKLLEESLRIREESGWETHLPSALHALAYARLEAGDLDGAEEALLRARAIGERLDATFTLTFIARTEADVAMARIAPAIWRRSHP